MAYCYHPFWRPMGSSSWGSPATAGIKSLSRSSFVGQPIQRNANVRRAPRTTTLRIENKVLDLYLRRYVPLANPVCPILGKRRQKYKYITDHKFIPKRIDKHRFPNMRTYKLWWEKGQRQVFLRCSNKGYKTIMLKGIDDVCSKRRINLEKLDFIDWSPEAVAFRRRYSGDYLPYNMVYGPPYNRKLKDPKKVAEAEQLLVRKWLSNRIVEVKISQEEAVRVGVMPDICYQHLPGTLKALFDKQRKLWEQNLPEMPRVQEAATVPVTDDGEDEDYEGDESDMSALAQGL